MLLGERTIQRTVFLSLDAIFQEFATKTFLALPDRERSEKVNRALLQLIQKEPDPCFLLSAVLDFVERADRERILHHYTLTSFELWLNQGSGLSFEDNLSIRAKIVGKKMDRSEYQAFFPIGMGKIYEGSHFVTAHRSPDLDTTIASFWGWVDAFGARVAEALHIWNLPGGPPAAQIEIQWIFRDLFGDAVFTHLAKTRQSLTLSGNDLMTQKGMVKKVLEDSMTGIEHDREQVAVVVVDPAGFYLGDWRNFDVEGVRQVIILLSSCLRWFENNLHLQLISLFAKSDLRFSEIEPCLKRLFTMKVQDCEPALEFTLRQKKEIADFLKLVIGCDRGLETSLEEVGLRLAELGKTKFQDAAQLIHSMGELFDKNGKFVEERPRIFSFLEKTVRALHDAILKIRIRLEKLDIALQTKREVFGRSPTFVTVRTDVDEIRQKMGSYLSLTVVYPDSEGKLFPVGIIQASDIRKPILGTVSLRDFCNREEMSIPAYLDVISVIDHHKTQLSTFAPPLAIIADAQSTNTLVAGQTLAINDRIRAQEKEGAFVHPDREYIEYLHFLYGILDDTDLLTKVSLLDVERLALLLNRMKKKDIVSFDDLPKDAQFVRKAARKLLQNEDMYSLYRKVYLHRENEVAQSIAKAANQKPSHFFDDTKEQNGCCRVGQTKIFASNVPLFAEHADALRRAWFAATEEIHQKRAEIDLHMHMISTVVSAEEVYKGLQGSYLHQDELWIWIPSQELAIEHLQRFLTAFQSSPGVLTNAFEVEFLGDNAKELQMIFTESFFDIPRKITPKELPIAILRYKAGTINSRKAMISPFLPQLV